MPGTAVKQAPIIGLATAIATFAVAGIAIATRGVQDHVLASIHVGLPLLSSLHIGNGFSPVVAGAWQWCYSWLASSAGSRVSHFRRSRPASCNCCHRCRRCR